MTMRSPTVAMLWENWRLTRTESAWKLSLGTLGGLAALVAFAVIAPNGVARDGGAMIALVLIVFLNITGWVSIPKINGKRPGFPFELLYTRPVGTAVLVGVPMGYQTAMPAATYLVSALILRVTSGYPFPLLPVAAWIAALNVAYAPAHWALPNRIVTIPGSMIVGLAWFGLARHRLSSLEWLPTRWPTLFDFPLSDYALIAAIGLASFGLTVAGVARQRRGDTAAPRPWRTFPDWLVSLFRFPCPTSSATRAQVWFELRSSGLPLLTTGFVLALVNPLLFALSVPAVWFRPFVAMWGMLSVLLLMFSGANAFGIRWRHGRVYGSAFEATRVYGTARLAGLKVFVRSVCLLAVLTAVGFSIWASLSYIAVDEGHRPLLGYQPLRSWQHAIETAVGALTGYQQIALALVTSMAVAVMVASQASFAALVARYPRRLNVGIAGWLLVLHGLVLVPLVLTGYRGVGSKVLWEFLLGALVWVTHWIDAPAIVLATAYVFWRAFAERLLTVRSTLGVALASAAFGAAWVTLLGAAGVQLALMSAIDTAWVLSPVVLPLAVTALAPWSLGRIRHT